MLFDAKDTAISSSDVTDGKTLKRMKALLAVAACATAAGCGYKGPLYLPPGAVQAQPVRIPVPPPDPVVPEGLPSQRPVPSEAAPPPR